MDPVFEETMHFLVRNPLTDTLLVKIMDKKTNTELGSFKQCLDAVYGRPEMKMRKQNFTLNTKSEAKVNMSMSIQVLKLGAAALGEKLSMEEDETDDELQQQPRPGSSSSEATTANVERSNSNISSSDQNNKTMINDDVSEGSGYSGGESRESFIRKDEGKPLLAASRSLDKPEDDKGMKVRLTIRYSQTSQQLVVVVHSVTNVPIETSGELPDPYVKLYVLPERNKKHKTEAQKDNCNPLYDERFEFPIIDLRGKTLEVTVCDKKFIRSSPKFGDVLIPLEEFQLGTAVTNWYPLTP